VVISGTMKPVMKADSPVPVEIYSGTFFKKNPTPSMFDAMQTINGVRPQLNCAVCNTGDIRVNGLDGPYTMVMIDGMPMVSSLGSVYGLSGIPSALIERMEVVKGPASSLYGSEAMGGLINIITKNPKNAPKFSLDTSSTTWFENNLDLGFKLGLGKKIDVLTGVNYFNYQNKVDNNNDGFTDMTLQDRISVFQKWNFQRKDNRLFSIAGRYLYEDRWGGDLRWDKSYRGGDELYAESIYTNRAEVFGNYQLPLNTEKMYLMFSYIDHHQNSFYGDRPYVASQKVAFGQLTWDKKIGNHDLLFGTALRYTNYDATVGGVDSETGDPITVKDQQKIWLPGVFIQDEISFSHQHKLLLGLRYDHNNLHGNIFTPRLAYKWNLTDTDILRVNLGTGYRVANIFTEEHEAMTGGRNLIIAKDIKPEKSYSTNINYTKKIFFPSGAVLNLDATAFYTHINNSITPEYIGNTLIYDNAKEHAVSKGISLNTDLRLTNGLTFNIGATAMENTKTEDNVTKWIEFSEKFTGTWSISYKIKPLHLNIDYTGNLYSPMKLPLLNDTDPRLPRSPWFSIQNIQLVYDGLKNFEIYGGVKNLLNWTPNKGNPFLIARANDPFDKAVSYNTDGSVMATPDNPYALTFDPAYMYAPNQGIRGFLGVRMKF
ncbi:MAG: TonB-dependent receptor, partial [Bergeyella zoohelcum]|nr:TonB-dependent receptor [Bergeyella zoohelcum]